MASLSSKRGWEVLEIKERKGVCGHGIPVNVSPARDSRSTKGVILFEANLSDGKSSTRVVSFDTGHRVAMKKAEEEESVVALSNSIKKESSLSFELRVHLNKRSKVISSHKLSLGDAVLPLGGPIKIADIATLTVRRLR